MRLRLSDAGLGRNWCGNGLSYEMHLVNSSAPESDSVPRNARPTRRRKVVRAVLIGLGVFVAC